MDSWDNRFLTLAHHVAVWSKDPERKVGAVIVNERRIVVGLGYNGFPRGIADMPQRLASRELKRPRTVHAEVNAVLNASAAVRGCSLYVTFAPCDQCAPVLIQAGIARVVAERPEFSSWDAKMDLGQEMLEEAGIEVLVLHPNPTP